jgi:hypothetical protein
MATASPTKDRVRRSHSWCYWSIRTRTSPNWPTFQSAHPVSPCILSEGILAQSVMPNGIFVSCISCLPKAWRGFAAVTICESRITVQGPKVLRPEQSSLLPLFGDEFLFPWKPIRHYGTGTPTVAGFAGTRFLARKASIRV